MILQAGRRYGKSGIPALSAYVCRLSDRLEQPAGLAGKCGTSPPSFLFLPGRARAGFAGVWANVPGGARAFRRGVVRAARVVWRKGLLELGACSSVG
jgi:hypothetical protein